MCFAGQPGALIAEACIGHPIARSLGLAIDTSVGSPICEGPPQNGYCSISGTTITISSGAIIKVTGTRPLVLIAYDAIDIEGTLDVGSRRAPSEQIGASADDARCTTPSGQADSVGGTGGAGGSFQFFGGAGGAAGSTPDGQPLPGTTPVDVHGGCRGGAGGSYQTSGGGAIGHSGGAVYLIAGGSITFGSNARLFANGEGGGKAGIGGGGGGGGSGGMIGLDAPTIAFASGALVIAEGGGGGGGGDSTGGAGDGGDGVMPGGASAGSAIAPAGSGGSGSIAGAGGQGGDGPVAPTTSTGGGGGGGGASGYVLVFGRSTGTATISPPPMP